MKKKLLVGGIGVVVAGVVFFAGSIAGASGDWKTSAINSAYSGFLDTAASTVNSLTGNVEKDIDLKVKGEIQNSVDEKHAELEKLLEQYYQMKLNGFAETDEFKALEKQIEDIKMSVFESYKNRIDEAFQGK